MSDHCTNRAQLSAEKVHKDDRKRVMANSKARRKRDLVEGLDEKLEIRTHRRLVSVTPIESHHQPGPFTSAVESTNVETRNEYTGLNQQSKDPGTGARSGEH